VDVSEQDNLAFSVNHTAQVWEALSQRMPRIDNQVVMAILTAATIHNMASNTMADILEVLEVTTR
jgi:hypothetical protein